MLSFKLNLLVFSNQIFHYIRCITPKRVTSLRGSSPSHCARATQFRPFEMLQRWQAVGNSMYDLTGPRSKPTSDHRHRDERVTA